jgi:hypothetical protein
MKSILPDDVYSFLTDNRPAGNPSCDVYSTSFNAGGTFSLTPVVVAGPGFYSKTGAMMTRRFIEPDYMPVVPVNDDGRDLLTNETGIFLSVLDEMALALASFLETRGRDNIRRFEVLRTKLSPLSEIGAFWTAILNLRLNSVPMLDAFAAVKESLEICRRTNKEIKHAIAVFR